MKGQLFGVACLSVCLALTACGGSSKVSSASLQPRLLPGAAITGFGLQRTLDWTDPVNLVGEGLALPQGTHPSIAVKEFTGAHLMGAAGEVLTNGSGLNETAVRVGVAKFDSAADANRVRDWMHKEDLKQPCFSQCIFASGPATVSGIPGLRFVIQSSHATSPEGPPPGVRLPPGIARGVRTSGPANYLAEFTIGPYLYWAVLQANAGAKEGFEQGLKAYYTHATQTA
jgi:hypothetical protein